jgi:hypothetical protein
MGYTGPLDCMVATGYVSLVNCMHARFFLPLAEKGNVLDPKTRS